LTQTHANIFIDKFFRGRKVEAVQTTIFKSYLWAIFIFLFFRSTMAVTAQPTNLIPLIQLEAVPITSVIETLTRQAEINYIVDSKLFQKQEPTITVKWRNISAPDALARLLMEHGLVMIENKFTTVSQITSSNHIFNVVDAGLLGSDTNHVELSTNNIIQFWNVKLDEALKNLIQQGNLNVVVDPNVSGHPLVHDYKFFSISEDNATMIRIHWENISARQAIVALCENYDLVIIKDSATGEIRIEPKH
jgi:hypothetical protein